MTIDQEYEQHVREMLREERQLEDAHLDRLLELRGWTREAFYSLGLAFERERIAIPVQDSSGALVGRLRYQPDPELRGDSPKMLSESGTSRELFPPPETLPADEPIWLVEGEPDAVSATSSGLTAVGIPGSTSWRKEWAARFAGRDVIVCCDCDAPGRKVAKEAADDLLEHASSVRVVDLAATRDDGYDIGELIAETDGVPEHAKPVLERLAANATPFQSPTSPLQWLDVRKMNREQPPTVEWEVEHVVPKAALVVVHALGGLGKSMFCGAIAAATAGGHSLAGLECRRGTVLYVDAENGEWEIHRRIHGLSIPDEGVAIAEAGAFDLRKHLPILETEIRKKKPSLVVLDSFRSLCPGLDENDTAQVANVLNPLRRLAHTAECAVLLIHHDSKAGKTYRGATSIRDSVDVMWHMGRAEDDPDPSRRFLRNVKMRVAPDGQCLWLRLTSDNGIVLIDPAEPPERAEVERAAPVVAGLSQEICDLPGMGLGLRLADIARALGRDPRDGSVRNCLKRMANDGRVQRTQEGRWQRREPAGVVAPMAPPDRAEGLLAAHADIAEEAA